GDSAVRACGRYIQITPSASPTVAASIDLATAGTYYYYPAITLDGSGKLVTVVSGSSSTTYASVYTSALSRGILQTPGVIHTGEGPYTPNRWGDYSGAAVDPSGTVWVGGEYARSDGTWGTWIANVVY